MQITSVKITILRMYNLYIIVNYTFVYKAILALTYYLFFSLIKYYNILIINNIIDDIVDRML